MPFEPPSQAPRHHVVVPVLRADETESPPRAVEVALQLRRGAWTIADLKLKLKALTGLNVHQQVVEFADHQLTDCIRVFKDDLEVLLDNGGFTLRRRDQKCSVECPNLELTKIFHSQKNLV